MTAQSRPASGASHAVGGDLVTDHDLPMLRVHRAWEEAEKIGAANGVSQGVALEIARAVITIVGEGTRRWGHLCAACRSLLSSKDGRLVCPEHGSLGAMQSAVLLISFDPITGALA